jgi:hypothetical protein
MLTILGSGQTWRIVFLNLEHDPLKENVTLQSTSFVIVWTSFINLHDHLLLNPSWDASQQHNIWNLEFCWFLSLVQCFSFFLWILKFWSENIFYNENPNFCKIFKLLLKNGERFITKKFIRPLPSYPTTSHLLPSS